MSTKVPGNVSNPPCSIQALLLTPLGVIHSSEVADLVCGSDCNYQADLKAGKRGFLKATFDFSFVTRLLRQAPCQGGGYL